MLIQILARESKVNQSYFWFIIIVIKHYILRFQVSVNESLFMKSFQQITLKSNLLELISYQLKTQIYSSLQTQVPSRCRLDNLIQIAVELIHHNVV